VQAKEQAELKTSNCSSEKTMIFEDMENAILFVSFESSQLRSNAKSDFMQTFQQLNSCTRATCLFLSAIVSRMRLQASFCIFACHFIVLVFDVIGIGKSPPV